MRLGIRQDLMSGQEMFPFFGDRGQTLIAHTMQGPQHADNSMTVSSCSRCAYQKHYCDVHEPQHGSLLE